MFQLWRHYAESDAPFQLHIRGTANPYTWESTNKSVKITEIDFISSPQPPTVLMCNIKLKVQEISYEIFSVCKACSPPESRNVKVKYI